MTVVIDCNILVACLSSRSAYHKIYQSLIGGKFNLAVTSEIVLEYEEIIAQKYNVATSKVFMALLAELPNVLRIDTYYRWQLIRQDPDDNKYCDCAIASRADYIITEDKHFNVLQNIPFPKLHTLSINVFKTLI